VVSGHHDRRFFPFRLSLLAFYSRFLSGLLNRYVGRKKLEEYRTAFAQRAGWTLFLARFAFGVRALAYMAAGAARYPWRRFLAVDGVSVALQVILFVGIGYYAGEKTKWAQITGEKIALLLGIVGLAGIIISLLFSLVLQKLSKEKSRQTENQGN
jgi:membrane protein DedA with SNARE-associated domain